MPPQKEAGDTTSTARVNLRPAQSSNECSSGGAGQVHKHAEFIVCEAVVPC